MFTNGFPFEGGEPFLESEIEYLSQEFHKIWVFPMEKSGDKMIVIPENVYVKSIVSNSHTSLKNTLREQGWSILKLFITEFIWSPKRWKYLKEFKYNLFRLIGLINEARALSDELKPLLGKTYNRIYSYWFNDNVSRLILTRWFGLKPEIVTRVHLYDFEEEFNSRGYLPFRYAEMRQVEKVVPISDYAKNYLTNRFKTRTNITDVSRLGAKPGKFNQGNIGDELRLVTCSSLTWYKRPVLLAELISNFKGKVHWVHFGSGRMKDAFLERTSCLPANIRFEFKGHVSNTEILEYYNSQGVDVLLNVSNFEGIPFSMMEAIAAGIPVIGCNICGVPEIVNSETGYLLPVDFNPVESAAEIEDWVNENARSLEFRKGVQHFYEKCYMASKNYPDFINKYLN